MRRCGTTIPQLAGYVIALGTSSELLDKHHGLVAILDEACVKAGRYENDAD